MNPLLAESRSKPTPTAKNNYSNRA